MGSYYIVEAGLELTVRCVSPHTRLKNSITFNYFQKFSISKNSNLLGFATILPRRPTI